MKCHQILTGACNAGDNCFAVGSVEGIPFTAYAAGCNIVILANTFERVQVIPGACHDNVQILCVDCSTDTGKIAAAYGKEVCIFEPTPLTPTNTAHGLDYRWVQTGVVEAKCFINTLSWNLEGTRLITAGDWLEMWASPTNPDTANKPVTFDISDQDDDCNWTCIWKCETALPTKILSFSPDGSVFATTSNNDRLVRVWYDNKLILSPTKAHEGISGSGSETTRTSVSFGYIYLPHPAAVTGFTWRNTSKYMPKGSVGNVLLTSCKDNICRIWAETVLPDDGLVSLQHLDPMASQNPRFRMHRHKHRFMQRLKHIKACFQVRRQAKDGQMGSKKSTPLPSLASSYSVHDFHMYGIHGSGITPGFHFHLSATINAETDLYLAPCLSSLQSDDQNPQQFVLHWLNNKELHFTAHAESILLELSKKALDKEYSSAFDPDHMFNETVEDYRYKSSQRGSSRPSSHATMRGKSFDEDELQSQHSAKSHPLSAATSTTSIATDATIGTSAPLADTLDRKIESLIRDWYNTSDILFAIHPVDGSLLVWTLDYLDGYPGSFRQAQISFSARIPNALPLGDAMNMSHNLSIYSGVVPNFLKMLVKFEAVASADERNRARLKNALNLDLSNKGSSSPVLCMTTKHSNGSLNLWHITLAEGSKFTQILNLSHRMRVCGHRFQLNDIKCHPVLPLLLTTSHHNQSADVVQQKEDDDWCSELILWRVDAVGPLSKSGGVTELSRINSPQLSAFSNVAWIPTLLPSTTLGSISNSPSACFVASDGESLRIYQAVIDGRALLAEISTAERKKRVMMESTMSVSSDSSLQETLGQPNLSDIFDIVSEQSTARPGCIIQLGSITEATHNWQNTQFLHVFQQGLIRGEKNSASKNFGSIFNTDHSAVVDLNTKNAFQEPFYVTLLEKTTSGPKMHMWRLVLASQHADEMDGCDVTTGHANEADLTSAQPAHRDASPLVISTSKVYENLLPLPDNVEVLHSWPAAGHLSSASIYPACFAPYVLVTACSDNSIRFWRCRMSDTSDGISTEWQEWSMINKQRNSAIQVPGRPLHVNAAYSGRIAVAYEVSGRPCVTQGPNDAQLFSCAVAIYECESTGGSEWVLVDTIPLKDIATPTDLNSHGLDVDYIAQLASDRPTTRPTMNLISEDEPANEHPALDVINSHMHVPSMTTLQSLKSSRFAQPNVTVKQKHPVQLEWLSMENGSHLLTVAIGNKILVYTSVSEDIQLTDGTIASVSEGRQRPVLKKTVSVHQISQDILPTWMVLEKFGLSTADGLTPLPMKISWVRDGIFVVGMDNEIHVYSQWLSNGSNSFEMEPMETSTRRDLSHAQLKSFLNSSANNKGAPSMSRITSYSVLSSLDNKMKKGLGDVIEHSFDDVDDLESCGLFEASHLVAPILPQYHPRQLIQLLNSGKIRRVKAILAHLLRYLTVLGKQGSDGENRTSLSEVDETRKSWHRSRTLSIPAGQSASASREGRVSLSLCPEEVTLDYMEVKAIPPLPLWLLLEADKETQHKTKLKEVKEDTYAELFGATKNYDDDCLDLDDDNETDFAARRKSLATENRGVAYFGPREAQLLASLLTHAHLPGLSSLDQMHLLALADTVASCNVNFADRFDINKAKEAMAKETYSRSASDEPSMESLDDCGLRFLLAIRHRTYLMRCLPLRQRVQLQKAGIGSHNIVWAFYSESQEELLDFIPSMRQGSIKWSELRELGAGWWVRTNTLLARAIQKVAKAAFLVRNDPLDAAIYYLAMKKRSLVWGLFRSICDQRMTDFFANNFTEERWRKAALKNAFALMGKQRFEHAAAFFLLAGALKDAIEVVVNKLGDEQLAFVIIRLYEGELEATPPTLQKQLFVNFLGSNEQGQEQELDQVHPDPFLRSLAYWMLKDYNSSLNTLLLSSQSVGCQHPQFIVNNTYRNHELCTADPSVFNFYIYLRTHPLLIRQCIANSAKENTGSFMASRLGDGNDMLDKKSAYENRMTPQERSLYFTTASAHLCAGCPTLALEVLSKLPNNVIDVHNPDSGDLLGSPTKTKKPGLDLIKSGTFDDEASFEAPKPQTAADLFKTDAADPFSWSTPTLGGAKQEDELDLDFAIDDDDDDEQEEEEEPVIKLDTDQPVEEAEVCSGTSGKNLDIMAQQLKFISCLKMMMEELATLATGCEVDGGQLRYELYIWLEREVEALQEICNYRSNGASVALAGSTRADEAVDSVRTPSPGPALEQPASLHEILQQEKLEFEQKVERLSKRKKWLLANQQLLRTLLSYCSLHGSSGGGLASVRMELILLLQELQQENSKQQLLSPLPFPTTIPLLSASIAANKTVVSDPVRHLQCGAHDILQSLVEVTTVATPDRNLMSLSLVLRNLAAALSACIYQSLCDSENVQSQPRASQGGEMKCVRRELHLVTKESRHSDSDTATLEVCTPPSKWPGVPSLLALIAREKDEDSPKLNVLLCESFVAVYLALLMHGVANCDAYVLYRLMSIQCTKKDWAALFGGCVRKTIKLITASTAGEKEPSAAVSGERILSTISSLQKTRIKLNMKLLGQLGFQEPKSPGPEGDSKPAYREFFLSPQMSLVSYLMRKPGVAPSDDCVDYDSAASDDEQEDLEYDEDEDVFKEPKETLENNEHCNTDSYSWSLLRLACVKKAKCILNHFLSVAEVELQELAVQSPLLHQVVETIDSWIRSLTDHMEAKKGPCAEYIPGCFVQSHVNGPSILKYKALLESHNTPFARGKRGVKPVVRLWLSLVRHEQVQDIFVRYIFGRKRPIAEPSHLNAHDNGDASSESVEATEHEAGSEMGEPELSEQAITHSEAAFNLDPMRIIHKDQDSITSFCINETKPDHIAIATMKEVQELNISLLLKHPSWLTNECELDVLTLNKDPESIPNSNFLVVQTPMDKALLEAKGSDATMANINNSPVSGSHSGKNAHVVMTYKLEGTRRMASHPTLPLYLAGCQDGSVVVREWGHSQPVATPRPGGTFAKVTQIRFNQQGNTFGIIDGDGHLSLSHLSRASQHNQSFYTHQCHNKHGNDFTFVGSSSLIATAGQSSEHRNVTLWDTLMPPRKSSVVSWTCHESGASAVIYAPQHQVLISAGKKGQVFIFDVRQRSIRHKFAAHEAAIKSMTIDNNEDMFVTGSADGDIKVWGLSVHNLLFNLTGEHSRTSLFKNLSQGVTQLHMDSHNRLFSCGADGSVKLRQLPDRDNNF